MEEIPIIQADLEKSGKPALVGEPMQRFLASDLRFHMHLLQAAGNRRIVRVIGNTRLLIRIFTFRREHQTAALLKQVYAYHRQILDAVKNKNPEEAARCMRDHIRLSLKERLAEYQQNWETGGQATGLDEI
jgi:DNA-binding FadR family transcriptional regulator